LIYSHGFGTFGRKGQKMANFGLGVITHGTVTEASTKIVDLMKRTLRNGTRDQVPLNNVNVLSFGFFFIFIFYFYPKLGDKVLDLHILGFFNKLNPFMHLGI
jgi:hypothetical protein